MGYWLDMTGPVSLHFRNALAQSRITQAYLSTEGQLNLLLLS